jgi:hypothetical protein
MQAGEMRKLIHKKDGMDLRSGPLLRACFCGAPLCYPCTYKIYAIRNRLVGRTTASGHGIAVRSHRVLSAKGSHRYSVRVRNPRTGRHKVALVLDPGPWNTNDDYWNPSSYRDAWHDLSPGMLRHRRSINTVAKMAVDVTYPTRSA